MNNFRYVIFKTPTGQIGYGCFAIEYTKNDNSLEAKIGASFCSPKDNFNKKIARKIALGRLEVNPICNSYAGSAKTKFLNQEDFSGILQDLMFEAPSWAQKAYKRKDFSYTLRQPANFGQKMDKQ